MVEPPATPEAVASARASVVETDAPLLSALGGTYLCDQRVFPTPPAPHLSAWEWAFPHPPAALATKLAAKLPGATRDGLTFRFTDDDGKVTTVVSVHPAGKSMLGCGAAPPGSASLVVASRQ